MLSLSSYVVYSSSGFRFTFMVATTDIVTCIPVWLAEDYRWRWIPDHGIWRSSKIYQTIMSLYSFANWWKITVLFYWKWWIWTENLVVIIANIICCLWLVTFENKTEHSFLSEMVIDSEMNGIILSITIWCSTILCDNSIRTPQLRKSMFSTKTRFCTFDVGL